VLYPQNGDRIVTIDAVMSLHPMYIQCSVAHAKRPFYRSADAKFGKVGRTAPEEVTDELINCKCMPILLTD